MSPHYQPKTPELDLDMSEWVVVNHCDLDTFGIGALDLEDDNEPRKPGSPKSRPETPKSKPGSPVKQSKLQKDAPSDKSQQMPYLHGWSIKSPSSYETEMSYYRVTPKETKRSTEMGTCAESRCEVTSRYDRLTKVVHRRAWVSIMYSRDSSVGRGTTVLGFNRRKVGDVVMV